jgi:hypothetical protein
VRPRPREAARGRPWGEAPPAAPAPARAARALSRARGPRPPGALARHASAPTDWPPRRPRRCVNCQNKGDPGAPAAAAAAAAMGGAGAVGPLPGIDGAGDVVGPAVGAPARARHRAAAGRLAEPAR